MKHARTDLVMHFVWHGHGCVPLPLPAHRMRKPSSRRVHQSCRSCRSGPAGPPMQPSLKGLAWSWAMVRKWSLQIMCLARVRRLRVMVRDSDGVIHPARVLARNRLSDIAVLALDTPLAAAAWRAGPVGPGLPVCAIGNAFGLGLSVTCGRVSATHRAGIGFNAVEDFIQTDAAVNPGMSGGALVDEDGALVGMLSAIFTKQSDANIGVNFAVHLGLVHAVRSAAEAGTICAVQDGCAGPSGAAKGRGRARRIAGCEAGGR
jgi:hypothetical protein